MAANVTKASDVLWSFVDGKAASLASDADGVPRIVDYAEILRAAGEAAYEWRLDTDRLVWSEQAMTLLGIRDARRIASGRCYASLLDRGNTQSRHGAIFGSPHADAGTGVPYQIQYALRSSARSRKVWIEDTGRWYAGRDGKPALAHGVVRVINDRHEREERLHYLSQVDPLTGEINRSHLTEQLDRILREAEAANSSVGFLLLAVDNLGRVNEAYGYDVADELIGSIAKRLRARLRAQDCLGRFSGNKFGIILRQCEPGEIGAAAERFLACVRDDVVTTAAGPIAITATIGGVVAPCHAANAHEAQSRAQEALDLAKEKQPGSFLAYVPNEELESRRRANMVATDQIITALNQRRILIAYEPVADARSREVAFHECLLRIRGADGSLIPAQQVIPIAERLGLVRLLDQRVLELVIEQMAAHREIRASLNVSASSTLDPDWWSGLEAMLHLHPDVAERLIVEITETTAIHDIDNARSFVKRVKDLGARIAIDDFGAGYTSFRNLRKLGVDMIKIDGAFVENLTTSEDDRTFVRTMIDLARGLKIKTVAEWVQNEQAAAILEAWGCDYLQGEHIGRATSERPASRTDLRVARA